MTVAFIQLNRGGTLTHYLSRKIDSGSTPTVTLVSASGLELVASQDATKGPRTTLDSSAAAGQTTIPLTATTDIEVGGIYLVTNATGQSEYVTVDAITSGESVTVRANLEHSYASSDVFESLKVSVSVADTEAASVRTHCRAQWVYESDSQEHMEESIFHVSKYAPTHNVTAEDITRRHPRAHGMIGTRQELSELIEEVWSNEVLLDFSGRYDPNALMSASALRLALIERVVAALASSNEQWEEFDRRIEQYRVYMEQSLSVTALDTDTDGDFDGADEGDKLHPFVFRSGRG